MLAGRWISFWLPSPSPVAFQTTSSGQTHLDQFQVVSGPCSAASYSVLGTSGFFVHCLLASPVALGCTTSHLPLGANPLMSCVMRCFMPRGLSLASVTKVSFTACLLLPWSGFFFFFFPLPEYSLDSGEDGIN